MSKSSHKPKPYPVDEEDNFQIKINEAMVPVYQADSFSKIDLIRLGITRDEVDHFKYRADLDYELLAKMLHVTKATLFNRKGNQRFDSSLSERLMALKDLYSYGYSVMGGRSRFNKWMKTENMALQRKPVDLADTLYGIQEIRKIIGRMDYGVYS